MNIPLSKRLHACCHYIQKGDRVADVGCDHGYLGIYLLTNHIASFVFAADINEMPLKSAMNNAERFGISEGIQFFLSNGLQNVPHNFDTLVCAGMGADTIISILEAAPWLCDGMHRLVLQCQSKTHLLRKYLAHAGWLISEESVLRDGRFLYTVMSVQWDPNNSATTIGGHYFSPALLKIPDTIAAEYYQNVLYRLQRAINGQKDAAEADMIAAYQELQNLQSSHCWLKE